MKLLSMGIATGMVLIGSLPARAQQAAPAAPPVHPDPVAAMELLGQLEQSGQLLQQMEEVQRMTQDLQQQIGQSGQSRQQMKQLQQQMQQLQRIDLPESFQQLFAYQIPPVAQVPATPAVPATPRPAPPVRRPGVGTGIGAGVGPGNNPEPAGPPERVTVPFRNGQSRKLVVDAMVGSVTVRGGSGPDAVIEATGRAARNVLRRVGDPPAGMHKIGGAAEGLDVNEDNNVIRVNTGLYGGNVDLDIQVPPQTSVSVKTLNGKQIRIENIAGEIEVDNLNGDIQIVNASGSVMAHSMNGKVNVSLDSVMHDKPMSFSTMNGQVDVTLPANIKANVKLKTDRGEMYTDFDIQLDSAAKPQNGFGGYNSGAYGNANSQVTSGKINGGGPEIQFTTFNGNILIHKK